MTKLFKLKKIMIIFGIILIVFVLAILFKNNILKILYPKEYQEYVSIYAKICNIEENLIFALIKAESNFDSNVVSNKGAIGLMQLMEDTARDVCNKNSIEINADSFREDLCEPNLNINIGTRYLKMMLDKYGNVELALAAYNAGIGTVDNWIEKGILNSDGSNIENIPYKETNNYVRRILKDYEVYKEIYNV